MPRKTCACIASVQRWSRFTTYSFPIRHRHFRGCLVRSDHTDAVGRDVGDQGRNQTGTSTPAKLADKRGCFWQVLVCILIGQRPRVEADGRANGSTDPSFKEHCRPTRGLLMVFVGACAYGRVGMRARVRARKRARVLRKNQEGEEAGITIRIVGAVRAYRH